MKIAKVGHGKYRQGTGIKRHRHPKKENSTKKTWGFKNQKKSRQH
jgi:hypothetical protein